MALQASWAATPIVIDNFAVDNNGNGLLFQTNASMPSVTQSFTGLANTLGGSRGFEIERLSGFQDSGGANAIFNDPFVSGISYVQENNAGVASRTTFTYDGLGLGLGDLSPATTGLTQFSLTIGPNTQLDSGSELRITVTDSFGNPPHTETIPLNLTTSGTTNSNTQILSSLANFSDNGVDLSDIASIELSFHAAVNSEFLLSTPGFQIIPEPSTMLLILAGTVSLIRRKR